MSTSLSQNPQFEKTALRQKRVVVTGIGAVSPLGLTAKETWEKALEGVSGVAPITRFDAKDFESRFAAEVKGFNPDPHIIKKDQKKMDLFIQYAIAAADMALQDAKVDLQTVNRDRIAVSVGTGIGGLPGIEDQHTILMGRGPSRISPFFIPMVISNLASGQIAIKYGLRGGNFCVTSACATGAHSIGEAMHSIRRGDTDMVLAGGTESCVCPLAISGFSNMRALSRRNEDPQKASRPFDKGRDGFVLGEGSCVLVLESYEHAVQRKAPILAELTGYGLSCDGYHMTNPAPEHEGAARAMKMALKDAGLSAADIGYVNAHGTSTPVGDELEIQAIQNLFGQYAESVLISSTKSMTGHLLGAAGALESLMCIYAMKDSMIPPTINLENPFDGCKVDLVPLKARPAKIRHALNNSFGFGGTNACLIFSKIE